MKIINKKLAYGLGNSYIVFCPGCNEIHRFDFRWIFDGNKQNPSFTPSLRIFDNNGTVCHSYLKNGIWEFLNDCRHNLAGKKIPLPDLPDYILN
jgi:hypothetical protein